MKDGTVIQMFPLRVARQSLLVVLWAISLLSTRATAGSFEFTDEFARFVPECAGGCFVAFLESHYRSGSCGGSSSLSCLCAERGPTGFTVGEGAVQCVETESSIGLCRGGLADDDDIERAYFMCSGQPGAVRPTHTAFEATFVVTGTAGGVVLAPPPSTLVSSRSSAPSTTSTTSSSSTSSVATSTSRADVTSTDNATSGSSSSPAPTADENTSRDKSEDEDDNENEQFGTAQIVGLSVGVAAAAGILLVIFLLARRRKKRYSSSRNSSALPIAESKRASSDHHPEGGRGNIFHISPPIHNHSPPTPAPAYSRGSWYPDAIGLAVSRPQSNAPPAGSPPQRRTSRLLPPKPEPLPRPMLTLNIPHVRLTASPPLSENPLQQGQAGRPQTNSEIQAAQVAQLTAPPRAQAIYRESTMTEFEEDSCTHPSVTAPPTTSQIWRPPSSDPKSATTYYVADKNGNWVLGDPTRRDQQGDLAELEAPTSLTSLPSSTVDRSLYAVPAPSANTKAVSPNDGRPNCSSLAASGSETKPDQPGLLQLPLPHVTRTNAEEVLTRSSSVYSQSQGGDSQTSSGRNVPAMSFSHPEPPRHRSNSLTKTRSHRPGNSLDRLDRHGSHNSRDSSNSITTFASSSVGPEEDNVPNQDQTSLSPVVESPASGAGPSPATRDRDAQGFGHLIKPSLRADPPPPLRPSFNSPPGQPSPTLGMLQPAPSVVRRANRMGGMDVPPRHPGRSKLSTATAAEPVTELGPRIVQPSTGSRPDPSQFRSGSPLLPTMRMVPQSRVPSSSSPYPEPLRLQRPQRSRPDDASWAAQHVHTEPYRGPPHQGPPQQQRGSPSASHFHRAMWGPERHSQQHQRHWQPQPPHLQGHPALRPPQDSQQQERLRLEQHLRQPQYHQDGPYHLRATHYHQQQQQPQSSRPSLAAQSSDSTTTSSYCSSSSSSLAAKRVGNERAAALSLQRARDDSGGSSERWQREGQEKMSGGLSDISSRQGSGSGQLATPTTAGWQPRLTPTRRGDDLYLNVH